MKHIASISSFVLIAMTACQAPDQRDVTSDVKFDSALATLMDFEFDGTVQADSVFNNEQLIRDQLLYTIGHLNEQKSVGRLDALVLSNVIRTALPNGTGFAVTYHAKLPVAWGSKTNLPSSYQFTLPKNMGYEGQEAFTNKYNPSCVEAGAHDVSTGSMWYYYRPGKGSCRIDSADVVKATATTVRSQLNSDGKYPEYDLIWERDDNALKVVAIFGKFEDGTTTSADAGIAGYESFISGLGRLTGLANTHFTTTDNAFSSPGDGNHTSETIMTATKNGKAVEVVAMLVDNVRTTNQAFKQRYNQKSTDADVIMYNGHAGLGDNVRALARRGNFKAGKYLLVFMNGCDTFAYVDGSLAQTRAVLNPNDPTGTKFMDIITNAMPSYFNSMPYASLALIQGLLEREQPKTFKQMFNNIDRVEVVLVTGEEDNSFHP